MKDDIISFTKLDITQLRVNGEITQELPTIDFLERLKNTIISDVSKDRVHFDKYEQCYKIFHNRRRYIAYFGNSKITNDCEHIEVLQVLNKLVELTKEQQKLQNNKGKITIVKTRTIDEIVKDGDNGIFYTEDDKVKYIKYYREKLAKNKFYKGCWQKVSWRRSVWGIIPGMATLIGSLTVSIVFHNLWFFIGILCGIIDAITYAASDSRYSPLNFLLQKLFSLPATLFNMIKKGISKLNEKRRLKIIENSIMKSELTENMTDEFSPKVEDNTPKKHNITLKGEARETVRRIFSKLELIKDKEAMVSIAKELKDIIEMFQENPDEDYNKKYSEILYLLSFLDGKTSDILKSQLFTQTIADDHRKTVEKISHIDDEPARRNANRK